MSLGDFKDIAIVINLIVSIGGFIYAYLTRAGREAVERVDKAEKTLVSLDLRVTKIESELEAVPGKDDFHKMQIEMTRMNGVMEVLAERIKPIAEQARRAQEAMMGDHK